MSRTRNYLVIPARDRVAGPMKDRRVGRGGANKRKFDDVAVDNDNDDRCIDDIEEDLLYEQSLLIEKAIDCNVDRVVAKECELMGS